MEMRRGEVHWVRWREPEGSEPGFRRPVIVLQADAFNRSGLNTSVGVALTTNLGRAAIPGNVLVRAGESGLAKDSVAVATQIVTFDKAKAEKKAGRLPGFVMARVEEGVRLALDLR